MFRLSKFFIKETLVSFYKEKEVFFIQKRTVKADKIISEDEFELSEEQFLHFIKSCFIENTQTYISTIIDTFNQGCVDSCSHSKYKELGINIDNIKILCLKDYSIFIGVYELNNYIKEMKKFSTDFIFSPYLIVDINKKKLKNTLYILHTNNIISIVIYEDGIKPKYSNIYQLKSDENNDDEKETDGDTFDDFDDDIDLVDDIEELEDLDDDIDDNIDDNIDNISDIDEIDNMEDDTSMENEIVDVKNEIETIEFVKNSIKDYYENYSDNFLERIIVFYNQDVSDKFITNLKNETLLDVEIVKINILSLINELALKDLNV